MSKSKKVVASFKVGDLVTWKSQASGYWKTKIGTIVEVVPAFKVPRDRSFTSSRHHESYIVEVTFAPPKAKKGCEVVKRVKKPERYWPLVSGLRYATQRVTKAGPAPDIAMQDIDREISSGKFPMETLKTDHLPVKTIDAGPDCTWKDVQDAERHRGRGERELTMARFTKRPVTIEAVQWKGEMTQEMIALLKSGEPSRGGAFVDGDLIIETREGKMLAMPGDWVIRGVMGELYPCKPDIFAATYNEGESTLPSYESVLEAITAQVKAALAPAVLTIKGDLPPEQFAAFREKWNREVASLASRAPILNADTFSGDAWVEDPFKKLDEAGANGDFPVAKIVDQPPPHARPELIPAWEKVIEDYRERFSDYLNRDTHGDPIAIENSLTVSAVLDDMRARDKTGRERYGVPLTAFNGRDQLVDAYQEKLDAAVYLRAAMLEEIPIPACIYRQTLDDLTFLRRMITERAKDPRTL